jgi:hypothetical protein
MAGSYPQDYPHPTRNPRAQLYAACTFYGVGLLVLILALSMRVRPVAPPVSALARALDRGEVAPHLPRLDAEDAMANAAVLNAALAFVPHPGLGPSGDRCRARPRTFAVLLHDQLSRVRFGARSVCQLQLLKQISAGQPGYGERGLAEVAAFVLGRRLAEGADVDVTRIVVPPFRFSGDTVTFQPADLGALEAGERFLGTYHTHPDDDLQQGVLSETDLEYMRSGFVDFAGSVGALAGSSSQLDWLFDIVDPKLGDWNVYAHDAPRLGALRERCSQQSPCPINELRIAGSAFNLYSRVYEEREDDWP